MRNFRLCDFAATDEQEQPAQGDHAQRDSAQPQVDGEHAEEHQERDCESQSDQQAACEQVFAHLPEELQPPDRDDKRSRTVRMV